MEIAQYFKIDIVSKKLRTMSALNLLISNINLIKYLIYFITYKSPFLLIYYYNI